MRILGFEVRCRRAAGCRVGVRLELDWDGIDACTLAID